MAILSRRQFGEQAREALENASDGEDGLRRFAVWTENDVANNRIVVRKIEPYDPRRYYKAIDGIVRAKDELDVYRFIESYNR